MKNFIRLIWLASIVLSQGSFAEKNCNLSSMSTNVAPQIDLPLSSGEKAELERKGFTFVPNEEEASFKIKRTKALAQLGEVIYWNELSLLNVSTNEWKMISSYDTTNFWERLWVGEKQLGDLVSWNVICEDGNLINSPKPAAEVSQD
jgi:hypothetical protein